VTRLLYLEHALVDLTAGRVHTHRGSSVALTPMETRLLEYLCVRRRCLVSRDLLLQQVWGYAASASSRTVDRTIVRLRRKIEPHPERPLLIQSVRGEGYRWHGPAPAAGPGEALAPAGFVGRLSELARLAEMDQPGAAVAVTGPPAIGKTSLLQAHVASQPADRCVLWATVQRCATEQDLLESLAGLLGSREAAAERVRAELCRRPGALLVLDGAERLQGALQSLSWLLRPEGTTTLLSSRHPPEGVDTIELGGLQDADARGLLLMSAATLGFVAGPEALPLLDRLVAAVGGHPLALRLLASQVALFGAEQAAAALPASDSLRALERRLLAALEQEDPALLDALVCLGAWSGFTGAQAQAVGVPPSQLEALLRRSWLRREPGEPPRFWVHELVRAALPAPRRETLDAMASWLLGWGAQRSAQMDAGDALTARSQALAERHNLLAAFEHLCETGQADAAAGVVRVFVDTGFEIETVRRLIDRAVALPPSPAVEADLRMICAALMYNRADHAGAEAQLQRALELTRGQQTALRATCLTTASESCRYADPDRAAALLDEVATIPARDPAELACARGRLATARGLALDAVAQHELALAHEPPRGTLRPATRQIELGWAYLDAGRPTEARYHLSEGVRVTRALQAPSWEGHGLWGEGLLQLLVGCPEQAQSCFAALAEVAPRSGILYFVDLARAGQGLGELLSGRDEAGAASLAAALAGLRLRGGVDPWWFEQWQVAALWRLGRAEEARRLFASTVPCRETQRWAQRHLQALLQGQAPPRGPDRPQIVHQELLLAALEGHYS
jgi:DNA-binding winged helix-turn-helix (wHTH) protein